MKRTLDELVIARDINNAEFYDQAKKYVESYIKKHYFYRLSENDKEELIQAGICGMMEAYNRFDIKKKSFSSYCYLYVRGAVFKAYCREVLKMSEYYGRIWLKLWKIANELEQCGEKCTIDKLAQRANVSKKVITNTLHQKLLWSRSTAVFQ